MCDVSKGLSYLHSVLVSHNDIFQKNIVISKSFTTQIADFGQAEVFNSVCSLFANLILFLFFRREAKLQGVLNYSPNRKKQFTGGWHQIGHFATIAFTAEPFEVARGFALDHDIV